MTWRLRNRPLRRILVTRLRYLGDVVLSTVVADLLKRGDPQVEIGFLCEAAYAPVLADHPAIDRVHVLGTTRRGDDAKARTKSVPGVGRSTLGLIRELHRTRYDLAVDLFFNPRSAWLLRLAGLPLRVGGTVGGRRRLYTHSILRETVADPQDVLGRMAPGTLGDHVCRLAPLVHGADERPFLEWLSAPMNASTVQPCTVAPPLMDAGRAALEMIGIEPEADWLLTAPGATWPAKAWPQEHWRTLLARIARSTGMPVAVLVPPGAPEPWSRLPGALAPLPLSEALGLAGQARALVTVDGGVMHAAVAMGTPTVALFGPTDPAIWFPYADRSACRVLAVRPHCHPCDRHDCPIGEFVCLPDLEPQVVMDALDEVLAASGGER
ncbi:MAG: glycosyltransferase family 9 protein [bacterium]|nr:glycosyltransferase family 9 protein [bacterium]